MTNSISGKRLRTGMAIYFAMLTAAVAAYMVHDVKRVTGWSLSDWLINYQGGFVRRGLLGELLFRAAHTFHLSPEVLTAALETVVFAVLILTVWNMLRGLQWSFAWIALLLSPAAFALPVLDPPAAVRKEFLLFAALALLIWSLLRARKPTWWMAIGLAVFMPCMILSHEATAIYLPYMLVPFFLSERANWKRAAAMVLPTVLLSAIALYAATTHKGDLNTALAICSSLGGTLPAPDDSLCGGAINYLQHNSAFARMDTAGIYKQFHYRTVYPIPTFLAMLPVAVVFWQLSKRGARQFQVLWIGSAALLSMAGSIVLFIYAVDWGRWVHMHVVCLLLLMLMVDRVRRVDSEPGLELSRNWPLKALLVVVFSVSWTLPASGVFPGRFGYLDMVRYLRQHRHGPNIEQTPTTTAQSS